MTGIKQGGTPDFTEEEHKKPAASQQTNSTTQNNTSTVKELPDDIKEQLQTMVNSLSYYANNSPRLNSFDALSITPYLSYIRFDSKMNSQISSVPKDVVINILNKKNPDLAYLVQNTDLDQKFDKDFNVCDRNSYLIIPKPLSEELQNSLYLSNIEAFNTVGQQIMTIPDYGMLSLFINSGDQLRNYRKIVNALDKKFNLIIGDGANHEHVDFSHNELFNSKLLRMFVEKTGQKQIYAMMNDNLNLLNTLDDQRYTGNRIRDILYQQLFSIHPELCAKP